MLRFIPRIAVGAKMKLLAKHPGSLGKRMYCLPSLLTDQTVPLSGVCEGC
jgi:hypothetical protein